MYLAGSFPEMSEEYTRIYELYILTRSVIYDVQYVSHSTGKFDLQITHSGTYRTYGRLRDRVRVHWKNSDGLYTLALRPYTYLTSTSSCISSLIYSITGVSAEAIKRYATLTYAMGLRFKAKLSLTFNCMLVSQTFAGIECPEHGRNEN